MGTDFSNIGTDFSKLGTDFSAIGTDFRAHGTSFAPGLQDYEGYPLNLDLKGKKTLKNYTLFGNTIDAKGVGDEVVQMFPQTIAEATKKGITYKVENGRLTANGTRTEAGEITQNIGAVKAGHTYVGVFGLAQPQFNIQLFKSGVGTIYWHKGNSVVRPTADMSAYLQIGLGGQAGVSYNIDTIPSLLDLTGTPYEDCATADDFAHRLGYADAEHLPAFPYGSSFVAPIRVSSESGDTLYPSVLSSPLHKIGDIVDYKESNGKEHHAFGVVDGASLPWAVSDANRHIFSASVPNIADYPSSSQVPIIAVNGYTPRSQSASWSVDMMISRSRGTDRIFMSNQAISSVDDFVASLRGVSVVYPLATPTEVQGEPLPRLAIPKGESIVTLDTEVEPSNIKAKI